MPEKLTKVNLTNLGKVLYPETRITKRQVVEYYIRMAPRVLDILLNRPVVLTRYPDGVDKGGFYEKDAPPGTPSWVKTFRIHSDVAGKDLNYVLCNDLDTLIWLANLASLEIHVTLSTRDNYDKPDLVLFDLDPEPPASYDEVVTVALLLKEKFDGLGLRSYVKTSGKTGLHIVIPITREYSFNQTRGFVHQIGSYLAKESPIVISESSRNKKPGSVYIDYVQNSQGRTMICPYSLRATPQATVSMPLGWNHIEKGLKPYEFNLSTAIRSQDKPWDGLLENAQRLETS